MPAAIGVEGEAVRDGEQGSKGTGGRACEALDCEWFLCCPPKLAEVIDAYEESHSVRHFRDDNRFVQTAADVDWIKTLAEDDPPWIVVSMDAQILKKAHERKALDEFGAEILLVGHRLDANADARKSLEIT